MKRNKFNLSYTKLASLNMGGLYPIGLTEVLPGDSVQQSTSALVRCSPLLAPVMHPVNVRIHHWFVPHRLVWDNFENFITGGPDGLNASVFPTLQLNSPWHDVGSLHDHLGVPTGATALTVSALPARGYALIFNEWYRDQDLMALAAISKADGADVTTNLTIKNAAWEKDYFTTARPWEQKGPAVTIPISGTAPVVFSETGATPGVRNLQRAGNTGNTAVNLAQGGTTAAPIVADANLLSANVTVNQLRAALALQRFEEARARYGSRYTEYLMAAFGVRSSDARLNRPEYLGGGRQTIQFSEVLATAETGTAVDVGDMKGHGIAAMKSNRYRAFFEEHGYIHTFMSILPKTIYADGLFRHWNRRTKTDFFQKELEHIGQQAVLNKEVYWAHATPDGTFGYQDRYDDYRRSESLIAGEFRSSVLNFWHMARLFSSDPALNSTFVTSVPTERIFAVNTNDVIYVHARHSLQMRRLITGEGKSFIF